MCPCLRKLALPGGTTERWATDFDDISAGEIRHFALMEVIEGRFRPSSCPPENSNGARGATPRRGPRAVSPTNQKETEIGNVN